MTSESLIENLEDREEQLEKGDFDFPAYDTIEGAIQYEFDRLKKLVERGHIDSLQDANRKNGEGESK